MAHRNKKWIYPWKKMWFSIVMLVYPIYGKLWVRQLGLLSPIYGRQKSKPPTSYLYVGAFLEKRNEPSLGVSSACPWENSWFGNKHVGKQGCQTRWVDLYSNFEPNFQTSSLLIDRNKRFLFVDSVGLTISNKVVRRFTKAWWQRSGISWRLGCLQ